MCCGWILRLFGIRFLLATLAAAMAGCAGGVPFAARLQTSKIEKALGEGKVVLVYSRTVFEPRVGSTELIRLAGSLRPPVTYWRRVGSKDIVTLGDDGTRPPGAHELTRADQFYILEPGRYDFLGYVQKTRQLTNLYELPKAERPISSSLGFVKFSATTLPRLFSYTETIPAKQTASLMPGGIIGVWYEPERTESRIGTGVAKAGFVDMRGMPTNTLAGAPTLGSVNLEAGQIVVIGDFGVDFTFGACDAPQDGKWICPLTTLTLEPAVGRQEAPFQERLAEAGYDTRLIAMLRTAPFVPGEYFSRSKPEPSTLRGHIKLRSVSVSK